MNKKKKMTLATKRAIVGLLFLSPWIIGFLAFYVRSLIMSIQFSLNTVNIDTANGGYTLTFNGIKNFIYAFAEHGSFSQTLVLSLQDILIDVPLIVFFSLFMAMLMNKKFRGRTLVRAIFFLPVIMNSEAIISAIDVIRDLMMGGLSATSGAMSDAASSGVNMDYYIALFGELALPDSLLYEAVRTAGTEFPC